MRLAVGVFVVLHGLVHLLYAGHSLGFFELEPGLAWPEGSWAFSSLAGDETAKWLAATSCALAAIGFVVAGAAILLRRTWWHPVVAAAAVFSSAVYILFWDGGLRNLDGKGGVGLLINIFILVTLVWLRWPNLDF